MIVMLGELVLARCQWETILLLGSHASHTLTITDVVGKLLAEHLLEFRFVVPEVMMAGTATHKEIDYPFCLRCVMRQARTLFTLSRQIRAEQVRHSGGTETECGTAEQLPPCHHQLSLSQRVSVSHDFLPWMKSFFIMLGLTNFADLINQDRRVTGQDGHGHLGPGGVFYRIEFRVSFRFSGGK